MYKTECQSFLFSKSKRSLPFGNLFLNSNSEVTFHVIFWNMKIKHEKLIIFKIKLSRQRIKPYEKQISLNAHKVIIHEKITYTL